MFSAGKGMSFDGRMSPVRKGMSSDGRMSLDGMDSKVSAQGPVRTKWLQEPR